MIYLILPILLIIAQGVFTASETGFISISKMRVLRAKQEKKIWAIRMSNFLATPERFFSTINVCENFILVVASTLFAKFFIENLGDNGVIFSTILLALFSLTIGQFIPKSITLSNPDKTMIFLSEIIYYAEIITYPIVHFYANLSKGIAYLFKSKTKTDLDKEFFIV